VADDSFATPEETAEAAVSDIPPKYVRVEGVSYSDDGSSEVVTLLTNEEPYLYPYYVHCLRDDSGRWTETYSSTESRYRGTFPNTGAVERRFVWT
jgi:hypothetical protein